MNRKLRMGMVGGGKDAFIGSVHRMAAALDQQIEVVAGVFSREMRLSPVRVIKLSRMVAVLRSARVSL